MSGLDIKYWPSKDGPKNGYLGMGYIQSGLLKARFKVYESQDSEHGFRIALHSEKKTDGTWDNDIVKFINADAANQAAAEIKSIMNSNPNNSSGVKDPTKIKVNSTKTVTMKRPF